jgi:hypothetical protein
MGAVVRPTEDAHAPRHRRHSARESTTSGVISRSPRSAPAGRRGWVVIAALALVGVLVLVWLVRWEATRTDPGVAPAAETGRVGTDTEPASPRSDASGSPSGTPAEAQATERSARRTVGGGLVRAVNLRLTPQAWAAIAGGDADARILNALAELVVRQQHRIDVSDLPRPAADRQAGIPARTAVVTAIDGVPVASTTPSVAAVRRILDGLRPPYRPDSVAVRDLNGRPVLVIAYRSASPAGLLPQASTPPS